MTIRPPLPSGWGCTFTRVPSASASRSSKSAHTGSWQSLLSLRDAYESAACLGPASCALTLPSGGQSAHFPTLAAARSHAARDCRRPAGLSRDRHSTRPVLIKSCTSGGNVSSRKLFATAGRLFPTCAATSSWVMFKSSSRLNAFASSMGFKSSRCKFSTSATTAAS